MPRSNASNKAKGCQAWKDMMLFREEHPEEFERSYHKRSNAQSTNASLKGKYGEFLHSRRWPMQKREAGLRIAHNIRRLIRYRIRQEAEIGLSPCDGSDCRADTGPRNPTPAIPTDRSPGEVGRHASSRIPESAPRDARDCSRTPLDPPFEDL
jgi:hypothetical protein